MRLILPNCEVACRAIVFDKDGTLIDFLAIDLALGHTRAAAIAQVAGEQAALAWQEAVGVNLATGWLDPDGPLSLAPRREELLVAAAVLYRLGHPWDQARALALAAYDRADEMNEPPYGAELLPGMAGALAELHRRGLLLAIATTDRRWRAETSLAMLGVGGYFAAMVGADDVANGKPAPDMVWLACERMGCLPGETVVVGDSPTDLEMGRAAGAAANVGVTTGLNSAERLRPLADIVLPTASSLPGLLLPDA